MAGWRPSYKQRCIYCKKNMVLITNYRQKPVCTQCQMKEINKPITDPKFKALFDIAPELYEQSSFLRNIKDAYLRYGGLSDKQEEVFKKVADDLGAGRKFKKAESPKKEMPKKELENVEEATRAEKVKKVKKTKAVKSVKKSKSSKKKSLSVS